VACDQARCSAHPETDPAVIANHHRSPCPLSRPHVSLTMGNGLCGPFLAYSGPTPTSRDRSDPGEIIRPSVRRSSVYAATSTGPPVWVKPGYQRRKRAEGSLLRRTWGSDKVPIETVRGSVLDADGRSPGARADDLPRIRTVFPSSREFRRSEGLSAGTQGSVGVRTEMDPWVRGRTAGAHPTVQSSTIRPRRRGAPAVGHPLGKSGLDERGR
jgi:hypothetical protein